MCIDYDFNHLTNGFLGGQDLWREWGTANIWDVAGGTDKYAFHEYYQVNFSGCERPINLQIPDIIYFRFNFAKYCQWGCGGCTNTHFRAQLRTNIDQGDGGQVIAGLKIEDNYGLYLNTTSGAWGYSGTPTGLSNGTFYEISFLYNINTKKYYNVFYAGQSMGDVSATSLYTSDIGSMAFQRYTYDWNVPEIHTIAFDDIHIEGFTDSNKYLHYPRWQPTRYGMRPFY